MRHPSADCIALDVRFVGFCKFMFILFSRLHSVNWMVALIRDETDSQRIFVDDSFYLTLSLPILVPPSHDSV